MKNVKLNQPEATSARRLFEFEKRKMECIRSLETAISNLAFFRRLNWDESCQRGMNDLQAMILRNQRELLVSRGKRMLLVHNITPPLL